MFSWGLVTLAHALITDSAGYLTGMWLLCTKVLTETDIMTQSDAVSIPSRTSLLFYSGRTLVIAITEGGVIPATLVYLGGFYKSTELASRLAWFWGVQVVTYMYPRFLS